MLNRAMFEVTSFDSAAPAGAAAVVHRFAEQGQFVVSMHGPDRVLDTRVLNVAAEHTAGGVTVDVGDSRPRPGRPAPPCQPSRLTLAEGGYACFTAAPGRGNRAMVRRAGGGPDGEVMFDTQRLGADDVFAVTLVRPGTYAIRDTVQGTEGRVVVTYPVIGDKPYRPADPVEVHARGGGLDPASVTIGPGQGLLVRVADASRITVDLLEPDDGPHGDPGPRPRGSWKPPRPRDVPRAAT
jgi:hypothetical protein